MVCLPLVLQKYIVRLQINPGKYNSNSDIVNCCKKSKPYRKPVLLFLKYDSFEFSINVKLSRI